MKINSNFGKFLCAVTLAASAGCTQTSRFAPNTSQFIQRDTVQPQTSLPTIQAANRSVDLKDYVSSVAFNQMSDKDKIEATSAQFNALQFGRPGAPRNWNGLTNINGNITVGPFVRVNNLDCREFVHTVKIDQMPIVRNGTSCRGPDGNWTVEASS